MLSHSFKAIWMLLAPSRDPPCRPALTQRDRSTIRHNTNNTSYSSCVFHGDLWKKTKLDQMLWPAAKEHEIVCEDQLWHEVTLILSFKWVNNQLQVLLH